MGGLRDVMSRRNVSRTRRLGESGTLRHGRRMSERYQVRPDRDGFSVQDVWTGEAAVIAMTPQTGLSRQDADHTARLLNQRAESGERERIQDGEAARATSI